MNDEQQLWRDVQKFMNQFPGFVAIAKKIGELGDLKTWQENEQRKLDVLRQEIEKQRVVIASEREAANAASKLKQEDLEAQIRSHDAWKKASESSVRVNSETILGAARHEALEIITRAQTKAAKKEKEITDVLEPKKAELESQIAELMNAMLAAKNERQDVTTTLTRLKDEHAAFLHKIMGR